MDFAGGTGAGQGTALGISTVFALNQPWNLNSKFQVPNSKKAPNLNSQIPARDIEAWKLKFLWNLELGAWNFRIPLVKKLFSAGWLRQAARVISDTGTTETVPTIDHKPHAAFFRQSGWLMMANIFSGMMAWAVHLLNKEISPADYGIFVTMLMVTACIPTLPLQMVPAQQTASALATGRERQLAGMIRMGWLWTTVLWAIGALIIFAFQGDIVQQWQLKGPLVLWIALAAALMNIWMPLFTGVLQGRQDFFWMGWAAIVGGISRIVFAALLVLAFHDGATGMIFGAFAGFAAWGAIAIWRSRDLWTGPSEPFDGRGLLKQVVPLVLGFGAFQFLFTTDMMFAKPFFSGDEMASYGAAGTLARALLWVVLPLATVMFPKIVQATAKSEKSNLLGIVLLGTAALAICGAGGLCLVGPIVVKLIYSKGYVALTTKLLPWYAGAIIPLALANVLVNDLMARGKFKVVLPMVLLVVAYGFTMPWMLDHFRRMEVALQTLGVFNLLLLAICAWFTWGTGKAKIENGR
jgi:O-antigen/teichoic acid export membrane protein